MIRYILIAAILMNSCFLRENQRLADFNKQLGVKKSTALDHITSCFETFLSTHYPDKKDFNTQFCCFIDDLAQNNADYIYEFLIPDSLASTLITEYQNSGLINELMIRKTNSANKNSISRNEEEVLPPEGSTKGYIANSDFSIEISEFNLTGAYHQALSKMDDDAFISDYVNAREMGGDMTYPIIISAFHNNIHMVDFNNPIIKRIVTLELYMQLVYLSKKQ